jgi:hypothetical protein
VGPSLKGGQYFLLNRLCVLISRAGVIFPSMHLAITQIFVSSMQQVMCFIFNCTRCAPDTLRCRHCSIAIFTHPVISFYGGIRYYYDIVVDICDIGVESFATRGQHMLVDYLRSNDGDYVANCQWCRGYWTGDRGRRCLCHSRYAGCNNGCGSVVA